MLLGYGDRNGRLRAVLGRGHGASSADQAARRTLFFGMIPGQSAVKAYIVQKLTGAIPDFGNVAEVHRTADLMRRPPGSANLAHPQ